MRVLLVGLVLLFLLLPSLACNRDQASAGPPGSASPASTASALASALANIPALEETTTGKVHSVGGELGTWDIALTSCQSGEVNGFYGADFYATGSDSLRLRFVHDEAMGTIVKVAFPSKPGTVRFFNRDDKCAVLEGSIEKTNATVRTPKGRIRFVKGHVKFDCAYEGKGHVTGEATFVGCH